ncbi:MAG: UrcA family protein [Pseudomonadota bacterium]
MLPTRTLAALLCTAPLSMLGIAAADELPDTFKIDVIFDDLEGAEGAEDFENRLRRSARRYCDGYAPGATRRAARACERAVIAAVEEALEDMAEERGEVIALNMSDN